MSQVKTGVNEDSAFFTTVLMITEQKNYYFTIMISTCTQSLENFFSIELSFIRL